MTCYCECHAHFIDWACACNQRFSHDNENCGEIHPDEFVKRQLQCMEQAYKKAAEAKPLTIQRNNIVQSSAELRAHLRQLDEEQEDSSTKGD